METGIASRRILDTPVAIIDFETTGFSAGDDRVVEVAVVRVDPGEQPRLVLDTLINPMRRVAATEIHKISDWDVKRAPRFRDIAGELLSVTTGCTIAAFNVYFDIKFLNFEMSNVGVDHIPPHFCLRYLRPMLKLGADCKLVEACQSYNVKYDNSHMASSDAMAAARLFMIYRDEIVRRDITTYADLARLRTYKFCESFSNTPYPGPTTFRLERCSSVRSRAGFQGVSAPNRPAAAPSNQKPRVAARTNRYERRDILESFWSVLKSAMNDLKSRIEKWPM